MRNTGLMLFLVEYERPGSDELNEANFDTIFAGADVMGKPDPQLVDFIASYGKSNGATSASIFKYEPKRLSDAGFRMPGGQELIQIVDLSAPIVEAAMVVSDCWDEVMVLRERVRDLERQLSPDETR